MKKINVICILLAAMMLFTVSGCVFVTENPENGKSVAEATELGVGEKQFSLTVTDDRGKESAYLINTDKETVGEALEELKVIEGEEGPYGLYIKTVNGLTVEYTDGGKYWAFFVDGQYATAGVDVTKIDEKAEYSLKVQH